MRVVAVFKVIVKKSNQLIREDAALLWHWKGICGSQAWNLDGDPMSRPLGWIVVDVWDRSERRQQGNSTRNTCTSERDLLPSAPRRPR